MYTILQDILLHHDLSCLRDTSSVNASVTNLSAVVQDAME
jgi:hypothetical protein